MFQLFAKNITQLRRGNIGIPERIVIGHHLVLVRNTDHVFAGFDQTCNFSAEVDSLKRQLQLVTEMIAVCGGKFIRQVEAVTVFIVSFTVHDNEGRNRKVFADVKGKRLVCLALQIKIDGQKACRRIDAVNAGDFFQIVGRKSCRRIKAVVGVIRVTEETRGIIFDGVPLHIEAQKNTRTQRHHNDHGNELCLVAPCGTE